MRPSNLTHSAPSPGLEILLNRINNKGNPTPTKPDIADRFEACSHLKLCRDGQVHNNGPNTTYSWSLSTGNPESTKHTHTWFLCFLWYWHESYNKLQLTCDTNTRPNIQERAQMSTRQSSLRCPFLKWEGKTSVKEVMMLSRPANWRVTQRQVSVEIG